MDSSRTSEQLEKLRMDDRYKDLRERCTAIAMMLAPIERGDAMSQETRKLIAADCRELIFEHGEEFGGDDA